MREENPLPQELSFEEKRDWLRLIRTDGVGPITFAQLLHRFGNVRAALEALPALPGKRRGFTLPELAQVEAELEAADRIGGRFIALCEADYPLMLHQIADPPPLLCISGDIGIASRKSVAIVGARNASAAGRKIASQLSGDLGEAGVTVVSGLARGIDGAAHLAALESGTIAVVAGGIDVIYPPEHGDLTREIARRGLLVSEMAPGYRPTGRDFPRRNRIISGLSHGVVVVEAAAKSGTLITARFALEQGRDVFAVPGSPLDPRSHGTNRLIRDGAVLVETAEDVIVGLDTPMGTIAPFQAALFEEAEGRAPVEASDLHLEAVLDLLSFTPTHRDDLIRASDLSPAEMGQILLELVLTGQAEEHTGGKYTRAV